MRDGIPDVTQAACADKDPDLPFQADEWGRDDREKRLAEQRATCRSCVDRPDCLVLGLAYDEHGVWGGFTRAERRRARVQGELDPAPVHTSTLYANGIEPDYAEATRIARAMLRGRTPAKRSSLVA